MKTNKSENKKKNISYEFIWPITNNTNPDNMNTSFGPRIKNNMWNFHEGIDIPASEDTPVHSMHNGMIHKCGAGDNKFSSRHVIIKIESDEKSSKPIFLVYLHLANIDKKIIEGVKVERGQVIGAVGSDNTTYPHLHMEFRIGTLERGSSIHPLNYLPFEKTVKLDSKIKCVLQQIDVNNRKARITFTIPTKDDGVLKRIEVCLFENDSKISKVKIVDFDKDLTISKNNANSDKLIFNKDGVGVEGYQTSDMSSHGYDNLNYGILIQNIPDHCNKLDVRILGVKGNTLFKSKILLPEPSLMDQFLDFEDNNMPPKNWRIIRSMRGINRYHQPYSTKRTIVLSDSSSKYQGRRGLLTKILPSHKSTAHAGLQYEFLDNSYFELIVKVLINPVYLNLKNGESISPICFLNKLNILGAGAQIYKAADEFRIRLFAKTAKGKSVYSKSNSDSNVIWIDKWQKWIVGIYRANTRETTLTLSLSDNDKSQVEIARLNYNAEMYRPDKLRIGMGFCPPAASGMIHIDNITVRNNTNM